MYLVWCSTWPNPFLPEQPLRGVSSTVSLNNNSSNNELVKPSFKLRSLLNLHRRMGVVSALFVIVLSLSGLVLHYSPNLNLDTQFVGSQTLLHWYEIEAPEVSVNFSVANNNATLLADALYFNGSRVAGSYSQLLGIVTTEFGFAVATSNQLLLLTDAGEIVEILTSLVGVPSGIQQIGLDANGVIYLQRGEDVLQVDLDNLSFSPSSEPTTLVWSESSIMDDETAKNVQLNYTASLVSWERILLDIHSGRFFGALGVVLVDIMAILFLLMAITGLWIWSRKRS
jgi:hypothetical protein